MLFDPLPSHAVRHRRRAAAACLTVAGLAAACAPLSPPLVAKPPPAPIAAPPPPPPPPEIVYIQTTAPQDEAARHLLAYQDQLAALNPSDLGKEIARLGDGGGTPQGLMDLALALGGTRVGGDLARAQALLDQVLRDPSAAAQPWHGLAHLLSVRYAEQRRAEEQSERLAQQLRDTQRDNQRRLDQLNEKLEALKAIERSLNSRFSSGANPGAPASGSAPAPKATP